MGSFTKLLLISLFILLGVNSSFSQKSDGTVISINEPLYEFYWGFKNQLYCAIPGIEHKDLRITAKNETVIISKEINHWQISVPRGLRNIELEIYYLGKLIHKETIRGVPFRPALTYIGPFENGEMVTRDDIIRNHCLRIEVRNSNVRPIYEILSMQVYLFVTVKDSYEPTTYEYNIDGKCFSDELIQDLKTKDVSKLVCKTTYKGPDNIKRNSSTYVEFVDNIKNALTNEKIKVKLKNQELSSRERLLLEQDSLLLSQKKDLDFQKNEIQNNLNELKQQNNQMSEQKIILGDQVLQIKNQKTVLYGFIVVLGIISFLLYFAIRNYRQKQSAIIEIVKQKELIEEKHHEIQDSITYAKRIQSAILPPYKLVKTHLNHSFILYKPKDIVAGDFYWMEPTVNGILIAAADCTGHGVPGAMVSVICNGGLNRAVREFGLTDPGKILDKTRSIVIQEFDKSEEEVKDGMDIALCKLEGTTLSYSGANNPLWIIPQGVKVITDIIEYKADKQPIGKYAVEKPFTTHIIQLNKNDSFYIFSDGYVDQFGGEKGKKFKTKNFKLLLLSIQNKSMDEQKQIIDDNFKNWRGDLEQIDDVCVIGIKV